MVLLYVINSLHNSAGMERVLTNKVNYLSSHYGYKIIVVTLSQNGRDNFFNLDANIIQVNFDINFNSYCKLNIFRKIWELLKKCYFLYEKLAGIMKEYSPNYIISLEKKCLPVLDLLGVRKSVIYEYHFSKFGQRDYLESINCGKIEKIVYNISEFLFEMEMRRIYKAIVLTNEDYFLRKNARNYMVIPNSLSFSLKKKGEDREQVVLAVGRLEPQKGYNYMIDIWEVISQRNPNWILKIYGDGSLKKDLYDIIKEKRINNIEILKPDKNIVNIMQKSSVYVMTSLYEGMPMVMLEAMACGLPIVSFDCKCGPKDLVRNGMNGFLVSDFDKEAFVDRLQLLIDNDELRERFAQSAEEIAQNYSEVDIMNRWNNLFLRNEESSFLFECKR